MHARIAADQHPPVGGEVERAALPVGGDPAGALDDRQHRAEIIGLQAGLDDQVDKAVGEEAIRVAIGAVAHELGGAGDAAMCDGIGPAGR